MIHFAVLMFDEFLVCGLFIHIINIMMFVNCFFPSGDNMHVLVDADPSQEGGLAISVTKALIGGNTDISGQRRAGVAGTSPARQVRARAH